MKTAKKKPHKDEDYGRLNVSRAAQSKIGAIAAMTRENQPEVIDRVCIPALDAELKRIANNGKSK